MEYAYSDNEELFYGKCATLEQALAEALDTYPDDESVWIGEVTQKTISGYFNGAESVLEELAVAAGDDCGEAAEDWLNFPPCGSRRIKEGESREDYDARVADWRKSKAEWLGSLDNAICAALEKWATENDEQPGFYHVGNSKQYTREEAEAILGAHPPILCDSCHLKISTSCPNMAQRGMATECAAFTEREG